MIYIEEQGPRLAIYDHRVWGIIIDKQFSYFMGSVPPMAKSIAIPSNYNVHQHNVRSL